MRNGWIIPGVILMLIMFIFVFVALPYPESSSVKSDHALVLYCPQVLPAGTPSSTLCFPGQAPITFSWSGGNATTWVEVIPCHTFYCSDIDWNNTGSPVPTSNWNAVGYGSSGSISLTVDTNISLLIVTNNVAGVSLDVTWNAMPEFFLLWEIFALFGMIIAVVGLLLPAKVPSSPYVSQGDEDQHPYSVQLSQSDYTYPQESTGPVPPEPPIDEGQPPEENPVQEDDQTGNKPIEFPPPMV